MKNAAGYTRVATAVLNDNNTSTRNSSPPPVANVEEHRRVGLVLDDVPELVVPLAGVEGRRAPLWVVQRQVAGAPLKLRKQSVAYE